MENLGDKLYDYSLETIKNTQNKIEPKISTDLETETRRVLINKVINVITDARTYEGDHW